MQAKYQEGDHPMCKNTILGHPLNFLDALASLKTIFKIKSLMFSRFCHLQSITEYYRVLQSITEYCRVLQRIAEYYRVLQGITEYYRVLQNITEYYRVLQSITEY